MAGRKQQALLKGLGIIKYNRGICVARARAIAGAHVSGMYAEGLYICAYLYTRDSRTICECQIVRVRSRKADAGVYLIVQFANSPPPNKVAT